VLHRGIDGVQRSHPERIQRTKRIISGFQIARLNDNTTK
jgi:hypothetical protein